jgi:thymidine phosphorylase
MRAYDLIRKKRDGLALSAEELEYLVWGATAAASRTSSSPRS